jgi:hypothetical protein
MRQTHPHGSTLLTRVNVTTGKRATVRAIASDITELVFACRNCFSNSYGMDELPSNRFILVIVALEPETKRALPKREPETRRRR